MNKNFVYAFFVLQNYYHILLSYIKMTHDRLKFFNIIVTNNYRVYFSSFSILTNECSSYETSVALN